MTELVGHPDDHLRMVFQPIVSLRSGATKGVEALARFSARPLRPPNEWFDAAAQAGLGIHLELAAIRQALAQSHLLPEGMFLSLNASPATLRSPAFAELLISCGDVPVVVELTEHEPVNDYQPIVDRLAELRPHLVRLAVDDTGAGFASLHHILKLRPDFIKLDRMLISEIDIDPARRSLVSALVRFSTETAATLIAEGIETAAELDILRDLGVHYGQGYLLGGPEPFPLAATFPATPQVDLHR